MDPANVALLTKLSWFSVWFTVGTFIVWILGTIALDGYRSLKGKDADSTDERL